MAIMHVCIIYKSNCCTILVNVSYNYYLSILKWVSWGESKQDVSKHNSFTFSFHAVHGIHLLFDSISSSEIKLLFKRLYERFENNKNIPFF